MNTIQRIAKNTGVLFSSQAITSLLGFFFVMYVARYLGAEGFGVLSFALAFGSIFGVFTNFGLTELTIREVARDKSLASKYLGNIILLRIIVVIIIFVFITLVFNLFGYPEEIIIVVYLIALSVILGSFTKAFYSVFQAFEKMEYQSLGRILNCGLLLIGAFYIISKNSILI